MNRESIVTGLFGIGLGLTLCSVILALTFSKVTGGGNEEITWTSGTYVIKINWVWLSNLFLTCGLGMFVVSSFVPILKRIHIKALLAFIPFSALYLLISALDIVTTYTLIKSGLGNEVNPIMAILINTFGVSYALSLNFAISMFIIISLMYLTEKLYFFSATILPLSFVRGIVVYNNMTLLKGYTLDTWFMALRFAILDNIPMIILFALSSILGATLILAFPEKEGEYPLLSLPNLLSLKSRLRKGENYDKKEILPVTERNTAEVVEELVNPVELTLLLERFRIKQEIINTLIEISKEISRKKGIPINKVTLQDIIEELRKK